MKRIAVCLATLLTLNAVSSFSQSSVKEAAVGRACNYTAHVSPPRRLLEFKNNAEAEAAVDRILRFTGLRRNFVIEPADVTNAAAGIDGNNRRFIYYSPSFIEQLRARARTDWAPLGIMVHEIAHHLYAHFLENEVERPREEEKRVRHRQELEADKYSGHILRYMGASPDEAQAAVNAYADEADTSSHPSKEARLAAIRDGWNEANDIIKEQVMRAGSACPPPTATQTAPPPDSRAYRISAANTSRRAGPNWWTWSVFIEAPAEVLDQIRCVEYSLHPTTFNPSVRRVCERGPGPAFALRGEGYGTFRIHLRVFTRDNRRYELYHDLTFQ
jgi:hypothetical protein